MRWFWTAVKVVAGVALTVCLLIFVVALVLPSRNVHVNALVIGFVTAVALYAVANRQLAALGLPVAKPRMQWRGERLVLRPRWVPQTVMCIAFATLVFVLAFVVVTHKPRGTREHWLLGLGLLFFAWITLAACLGFVRRLGAGFALRLDTAGVHYPGIPPVPWNIVRGLSIDPPRPDSDTGQSLVLEVDAVRERPSGVSYWLLSPLPGAHYGRGKVSLPLLFMHMDPDEVLAAAQELWRRNQAGV